MAAVGHGMVSPDASTVPHLRPVTPAPPFAAGPVLGLAGVVSVVLLALSGRYGYLSDELYFIAAGKYYLDWGYMDQQPLVPVLAAALDTLAPGMLPLLRLPAALVTVLGIVLTALIAREFGGDRRAQTLAAAAFPLSPWLLLSGHWFAAASIEPVQWLAIIWLVARWVRLDRQGQRRDRLLLAIGLVATVAVQTKFQVIVLCVALLAAVGIAGPRHLLTRPLLWIAAVLPLVTAIPTLLWQAANGWPALDMTSVVAGESDRLLVLPVALGYSGVGVGAVLCCYGLWQLCRAPQLRDYRFLGWAILAVIVFYLVTSGRPNYLAALYGPLFAAATVAAQWRRRRDARRSWLVWPAYLLSAVVVLGFLPIYPLSFLARHPEFPNASRLYETGWPELAESVAREYRALPEPMRERTAIVGETYHLAGALDVHGRRLGLPRAYSPHRGYWYFGQPPRDADVVLYVGVTQPLDRYFAERRELSVVRTNQNLVNLPQGVSIVRYAGPTRPWTDLWPEIRKP